MKPNRSGRISTRNTASIFGFLNTEVTRPGDPPKTGSDPASCSPHIRAHTAQRRQPIPACRRFRAQSRTGGAQTRVRARLRIRKKPPAMRNAYISADRRDAFPPSVKNPPKSTRSTKNPTIPSRSPKRKVRLPQISFERYPIAVTPRIQDRYSVGCSVKDKNGQTRSVTTAPISG